VSFTGLVADLSAGGATVVGRESVGSTNTLAMQLAAEGADHATIVVADHQTAGRGRSGRTWHADAGSHVLMSVIWRLDWPASRAPQVTLHAAVAVARAIEEACGIRIGLKWPNDGLIGNKKCAGILTELRTIGDRVDAIVIGVGIDVAPLVGAPDDVRQTATSLSEAAGRSVDRNVVACALQRQLGDSYAALVSRGEWDRSGWMDYETTIDRPVQVDSPPDASWLGRAVGVEVSGALSVEHSDGTVRQVTTGDVLIATGEGG
jgi:BirA family biotin operon repressor/biotin-[acetyl-CoA-carboxylase] ligase